MDRRKTIKISPRLSPKKKNWCLINVC